MSHTYVCIPFATSLTNEAAWDSDTSQAVRARRFTMMRLHLLIKDMGQEGEPKPGPAVGSWKMPQGASSTIEQSVKFTTERVNVEKLVRETFVASKLTAKVASRFTVGAPAAGQLVKSADFASELSTHLKHQATQSASVTESIEHEVKFKLELPPTNTETHQVHSTFRKIRHRVFVIYIDYLRVIYYRGPFGLFHRRAKQPPFSRGPGKEFAANEVQIGRSVLDIISWQPLQSAHVYVNGPPPDEIQPTSVSVDDVHGFRIHAGRQRGVPSLYQISEVAFPRLWHRRVGQWTEADLLKVEAEDWSQLQQDLARESGYRS